MKIKRLFGYLLIDIALNSELDKVRQMTVLDGLLSHWRASRASRHVPFDSRVLDIGCHNGTLLEQLRGRRRATGIGLDPKHVPANSTEGFLILNKSFPECLPDLDGGFDAVCVLAVLEHVPENHLEDFVRALHSVTSPGGRVVLTVPSPKVDAILALLVRLRLVDGAQMEAEQHHGLDIARVQPLFESAGFHLLRHQRFQLGLNNLFVFERRAK